MKISMLIHNFNRASALERCLLSICGQTYRPLETVILDAESTDDSACVIDRMCHMLRDVDIDVKVVSCSQLGVSASRNLAASHATGELLCFVDNDACFASADQLTLIVAALDRSPRLGLIGFQVLKGDTAQVDPVTWVYRRSDQLWAASEFETGTFVGTGFCVRASAFEEVGGFWNHLRYSREEEDLSLALIDKNWRLRYLPSIAIRHYPEPKGRMSLADRRLTELHNGILVLWRRLPVPLALLAILGRACTMARGAFRENTSILFLLRALPNSVKDWRRHRLTRKPIKFLSALRYVALQFPLLAGKQQDVAG